MKKNKEQSIRGAYVAPESTYRELMTQSFILALSKFEDVNTQGFIVESENEDDWM